MTRVNWKGLDDDAANIEIFSHLSWFLTGKNFSLGTLVSCIKDKIKSFIKESNKETKIISLQNALLLTKLPDHQLELKIDSYYKNSINCEVPLEASNSFVFDDNFIVHSIVSKPLRPGLLAYQTESRNKVPGFVLPVFSIGKNVVRPILLDEFFLFKSAYFKVYVVFKPCRILMSKGK